jgi:hypothetical protein
MKKNKFIKKKIKGVVVDVRSKDVCILKQFILTIQQTKE